MPVTTSSDGPEEVIARLLAFQRADDVGVVGRRERVLAHEICNTLRRGGWHILRAASVKKAKKT